MNNQPERTSRRMTSGILFGIAAAVAFGSNPFFARRLYDFGFDVDTVLLCRFGFASVILGALAVVRGEGLRVSWRELAQCAAGGLFVALTALLLFISYQNMDVGIAASLLACYPVVITLASLLIFHEKLSVPAMVSLPMAVLGVILVSLSGGGGRVTAGGIALALLSCFFYAGYMIWVSRSELKTMPSEKMSFYLLLTCAVFFGVRVRFGWAVHGNFTPVSWLYAIGVAVVPAAIALGCSNQALQRCGDVITSLLGALEPLTSVFIGIFVFREIVTVRSGIGIALILIAVTVIAWASAKSGKKQPEKSADAA